MGEEKSILLELKKMFNLLKPAHCHNGMKDIDLTTVQFMLLIYLLDHEKEKIFQRDIEAAFNVRRSTVTNLIQAVESKGYITRQSVDGDARLKQIVLTEKSKDIGKVFLSELLKVEEKMKVGIDDKKLHTFFEVIEMINRNMEGK